MLASYPDNYTSATGHVANGLYVCGLTWSSVYLLMSSHPLLFEAGFSCAARIYEKDYHAFLGGHSPEVLFLTHGHWDHCGSAAYMKEKFPELKIAASPQTESIVSRPSAQRLMSELATTVIPTIRGLLSEEDAEKVEDRGFEPFHVDIPLRDGQTIRIAPDLSVQALYTPGHTRDHVSFYVPERKILFGGEAAGCLEPRGGISVEFLVDYDAYLNSLRRLMTLPAEIYCLSHHFVLLGRESIRDFLVQSLQTAERFCERIYTMLDEHGGDVEAILGALASEYDVTDPGYQQPVESYLINLKARVEHLKRRRQRAG